MTPDPMPWLFLSTAILFEVAGITAMKLSRGFTEPVPSLCGPRALRLVGWGRDPRAEAPRSVGHLCRVVGRRHGARGPDRRRLFSRTGHRVEARLARFDRPGRRRAFVCH